MAIATHTRTFRLSCFNFALGTGTRIPNKSRSMGGEHENKTDFLTMTSPRPVRVFSLFCSLRTPTRSSTNNQNENPNPHPGGEAPDSCTKVVGTPYSRIRLPHQNRLDASPRARLGRSGGGSPHGTNKTPQRQRQVDGPTNRQRRSEGGVCGKPRSHTRDRASPLSSRGRGCGST